MRESRVRILYSGISFVVLLFLLAAAVFGACRKEDRADGIPVGVISYVSDTDSDTGRLALRGVEFAALRRNREGGILVEGRKQQVRILAEDASNEADTSIAAALRLINRRGAAALIGPGYSRSAIPVSRIAEEVKIPMITPSATNEEITAGRKYVFRACFTDACQVEALSWFSLRELGLKKIGVLHNDADVYGRMMAQLFRKAVEADGGEISLSRSYLTGDEDYREQLRDLMNAGSQAVFLPGFSREFASQVRQARELGYSGVILGSDGFSDSRVPADIQNYRGVFYPSHFHKESPEPAVRNFVRDYRAVYGEDPEPVSALFYDAAELLFSAWEKSGTIEPSAVAETLRSTRDYRGASGYISGYKGGDPEKDVYIKHVREEADPTAVKVRRCREIQ